MFNYVVVAFDICSMVIDIYLINVFIYLYFKVTLEEQMICGALQTLNEEAFEDVLGSERPSPTGGSAGEMSVQQQLAPIRESSEFGSPPDDALMIDCLQLEPSHSGKLYGGEPSSTVIVMPTFLSMDDTRL